MECLTGLTIEQVQFFYHAVLIGGAMLLILSQIAGIARDGDEYARNLRATSLPRKISK